MTSVTTRKDDDCAGGLLVDDYVMKQQWLHRCWIPLRVYQAVAIAALMSMPAEAAPVEVRFPENATHGYLLVRSLAGETIGQGEMTQVIREEDLVENRLVFRFKDGSLHDEKVAFSQLGVFTLMSYRLVQRGPSFPEQLDVSINRGIAEYTVRSKTRTQEKEDVLTGQDNLPKDVYKAR